MLFLRQCSPVPIKTRYFIPSVLCSDAEDDAGVIDEALKNVLNKVKSDEILKLEGRVIVVVWGRKLLVEIFSLFQSGRC